MVAVGMDEGKESERWGAGDHRADQAQTWGGREERTKPSPHFRAYKAKWKGRGFQWSRQAFCFRQCDNGWRHMLRKRKRADIVGKSSSAKCQLKSWHQTKSSRRAESRTQIQGSSKVHRHAKVKVAQACPALVTPGTIQSMEFSRQEYWSG